MKWPTLLLLLAMSPAAYSQTGGASKPKEPAKPAAGSLEETLEKSLNNSADILAAEAKVREAESELNRVRRGVLTKATMLYNDLQLSKRMLQIIEESYVRLEKLKAAGVQDNESLVTARVALEKQRGEVERLETELKSLRGEFALKLFLTRRDEREIAFDTFHRRLLNPNIVDDAKRDLTVSPHPSMSRGTADWKMDAIPAQIVDKVRKLLDTPVELKQGAETDITEIGQQILDYSQQQFDVSVRVLLRSKKLDSEPSAMSGQLPFGSWLSAMQDREPELRFYIREYGILVTTKDREPNDAIPLLEFWKRSKTAAKEIKAATDVKKPDPDAPTPKSPPIKK